MNLKKYAAPDGALFLILNQLQLCRAYGAKAEVMDGFFRLIKVMLPLAIVSICLFGVVLNSHSGIFREFQAALLSVDWMLLVCVAVWCGTFIFLTFSRKDLPLIGLMLIAIVAYFIGFAASSQATDAIILLGSVTLGRGTQFLLKSGKRKAEVGNKWETSSIVGGEVTSLTSKNEKIETPYVVSYFLVGLVVLLAFSSWWHLDMVGAYRGPRWMGLWDNPNIYGMLMGVGTTLAIGLLVGSPKSKVQSPKLNKVKIIFLSVAIFMMTMGLFFSYSRGAWVGTAVGLLYLAWSYGKLKWKYVALGVGLLALGVLLFWGRTADSAPWYFKRLDLSRPSAQHRVSAWRGALQMMRDHPLGVGWNNAVGVYEKNYSPPEDGAAAITMNSYLMLGTELGIPGLVCFVAYVALCLRSPKSGMASADGADLRRLFSFFFLRKSVKSAEPAREDARPTTLDIGHWTLDSSKIACRAGAVMLLVAFWFDGGLFTLATASVFWILLELGSERQTLKAKTVQKAKTEQPRVETETSAKQRAADILSAELTKNAHFLLPTGSRQHFCRDLNSRIS